MVSDRSIAVKGRRPLPWTQRSEGRPNIFDEHLGLLRCGKVATLRMIGEMVQVIERQHRIPEQSRAILAEQRDPRWRFDRRHAVM